MSSGISRLRELNPSLDPRDLERVLAIHRGALAVVVFGSAARGRFVRGLSDIDVLVVTEEEPQHRGRTLGGVSGDINVVYMSRTEFCLALATGNQIAREALEGVPLSGDPKALC